MAEIINLRRARKARSRNAKADQAAENRALHGRTKADKQSRSKDRCKLASHLDGHRLNASGQDKPADLTKD